MVSRAEFIQGILDLYDQPEYLEIGVCHGDTFLNLRAAKLVAVDPTFQFDVGAEQRTRPQAEFHAITSDEYFCDVANPARSFDVIFLDGLHTLEQTLRDFTNAIAFLKPAGAIVIDDVVPSSYHASLKTMPRAFEVGRWLGDPRDDWMGDVYRLVFFIETFFPQFTFRTLTENHGQLVAWRQRRPSSAIRERTVEEIGALPFEQVAVGFEAYQSRERTVILSELAAHVKRRPPRGALASALDGLRPRG